jgi:hypothetical protein
LAAEKSAGPLIPEFFKSSPENPNSTKKALTRQTPFSGVAQTVGFGIGKSIIPYLSMGVD